MKCDTNEQINYRKDRATQTYNIQSNARQILLFFTRKEEFTLQTLQHGNKMNESIKGMNCACQTAGLQPVPKISKSLMTHQKYQTVVSNKSERKQSLKGQGESKGNWRGTLQGNASFQPLGQQLN